MDPMAPGDEWGVRSVRFRITLRCGDQAEIKEESYDFGFGCYIDSCGLDVDVLGRRVCWDVRKCEHPEKGYFKGQVW